MVEVKQFARTDRITFPARKLAQAALSQVQSAARAAGPLTDGSVGDFVTSIRTACSLGFAWRGLNRATCSGLIHLDE
jgi:hypothetical protein